MVKRRISISLNSLLVVKLDKIRGLIPRSRYLEKIIHENLANKDE